MKQTGNVVNVLQLQLELKKKNKPKEKTTLAENRLIKIRKQSKPVNKSSGLDDTIVLHGAERVYL